MAGLQGTIDVVVVPYRADSAPARRRKTSSLLTTGPALPSVYRYVGFGRNTRHSDLQTSVRIGGNEKSGLPFGQASPGETGAS